MAPIGLALSWYMFKLDCVDCQHKFFAEKMFPKKWIYFDAVNEWHVHTWSWKGGN